LFYCRQYTSSSPKGYDHGNYTKINNRIVLYAEPQIGKTGAYIYLLQELRNRTGSSSQVELFNMEEDDMLMNTNYVDAKEFELPYHKNIASCLKEFQKIKQIVSTTTNV
jgi:hypothetical protein